MTAPGSGIAAGMVIAIGCSPGPTAVTVDLDRQSPYEFGVTCAPQPQLMPMPAACDKCGWQHTTAACLTPLAGYPFAPRMSDADVDRIARRVVDLLDARTRVAER